MQAIERHLPAAIEFGMSIPHRRINSARYGPQSRVRTFLGNFPRPAPPEPGPRTLREVLRPGPYLTLPDSESLQRSTRQYYGKGKARVWDKDRPGYTVLDCGGRHTRGFLLETEEGDLRSLSWQEAAALQGFPEDYRFAGSYGRAWKMVAQAIPIQVGHAILKSIAESHAKSKAVVAAE